MRQIIDIAFSTATENETRYWFVSKHNIQETSVQVANLGRKARFFQVGFSITMGILENIVQKTATLKQKCKISKKMQVAHTYFLGAPRALTSCAGENFHLFSLCKLYFMQHGACFGHLFWNHLALVFPFLWLKSELPCAIPPKKLLKNQSKKNNKNETFGKLLIMGKK